MFKVGDEVLCVSNGYVEHKVTLGGVYEVLGLNMKHFPSLDVMTDYGQVISLQVERFIPNTPEAKAEYMKNKIMEE